MPRLNTRGDYCAGVGEGPVHVNETIIAPHAGGIQWVNDDHVVFQQCQGGSCGIYLQNVHTALRWLALGHGANQIVAAANKWAVWFGTNHPAEAGITTSMGERFPDSGLGPMGPDGAYAIKVAYHSAGPWNVVEPDGSQWQLTPGDASDINLLSYGQALWIEGQSIHVHQLPPVTAILSPPWWGIHAMPIQGAWWLLYQAFDGRLVSHPFDSLVGYQLLPPGTIAHQPDWVLLPSGHVRIVYATSRGEWPGEVRVLDRSFTTARIDLGSGAPIRPPIEPPIEPPIIPPIPPVEPPVSIPNHFDVVARMHALNPSLLASNTLEACGTFTEMVVLALDTEFPSEKWGHVGKSGGQTQCPCGRGHAADAVMSQLWPATAIDIIAGAHDPPNDGKPAWQEVQSGGQPWKPPMPIHGGTTPPVEPPPTTDPQLEARVKALEDQLAALTANAVQYGSGAGFKMAEGLVLCANNGGGTQSNQPVTFESRTGVGSHETFILVKP